MPRAGEGIPHGSPDLVSELVPRGDDVGDNRVQVTMPAQGDGARREVEHAQDAREHCVGERRPGHEIGAAARIDTRDAEDRGALGAVDVNGDGAPLERAGKGEGQCLCPPPALGACKLGEAGHRI